MSVFNSSHDGGILSQLLTWQSLVIISLLYFGTTWTYNIFFHPLAKFPGPKLAAATPLLYGYHCITGEGTAWMVQMHDKYGEVFRFSLNEISFTNADAWKDIYGHKARMLKDPRFYDQSFHGDVADIATDMNPSSHSRVRRIFAHAFSDKALKLQEPMFQTYIDNLVQNIKASLASDPEHIFGIMWMYNFTTFDVMGDLTFGEPLDLLNSDKYHPWLFSIFSVFKFGILIHVGRYYSAIFNPVLKLLAKTTNEKRLKHKSFSNERVDRRLAKNDARPGIWGLVLARDEATGMSKDEMYANGGIFMLAGTETTATALTGLPYWLLKSPEKMKKLQNEIRSSFSKSSEITIEKLQALPYLQASVEEGLRMYPSVPMGNPRIVPPEGAEIVGQHIPGGTSVSVHQLATYRSSRNFHDSWSFNPDRFIDPAFSSDKKHALQPFSIGPRNCIGKNMAYHEVRLIISNILFHFDLELQLGQDEWHKQKAYLLWEKPGLMIKMQEV